MKTNKILATLLATTLIVTMWFTSVSAYWEGQWSWDGTWNNAQSKSNFVDTNNNWIADWEEDFDNDWILNKDDEDFEKINEWENMRDDDNDWIANKDDADYVKTEAKDWTNKSENAWTWEGNNENGQWSENRSEKSNALKEKIGKNADVVDGLMGKFSDKYSDLSIEEQKEKFETLLGKVNIALEKIEASNLDNAKKEAYNNVFEYIKMETEDKIVELEWTEDVDLDWLFD